MNKYARISYPMRCSYLLTAYVLRALAAAAAGVANPGSVDGRAGERLSGPRKSSRDFDWITPGIIGAINDDDTFEAEKIAGLREKGVYLRPLGDNAKGRMLALRKKRSGYVNKIWSSIEEVFGRQADATESGVRLFFTTLYGEAVEDGLKVRDLVILTFLAFYNCRDPKTLASPGAGRDVGGFTGLREEDFERLRGAAGSASGSWDYKILHSHRDLEASISLALELYGKMLESAGPCEELNMSFVLGLYTAGRYGGRLAVADNGISGGDLIALAAENARAAVDLLRMAYFHNKLSRELVDLLR